MADPSDDKNVDHRKYRACKWVSPIEKLDPTTGKAGWPSTTENTEWKKVSTESLQQTEFHLRTPYGIHACSRPIVNNATNVWCRSLDAKKGGSDVVVQRRIVQRGKMAPW